MTRALIVDLSLHFGGADQRVRQLANGLPSAGIDVVVAVIAGSDVARELRCDGVELLELPYHKADPRIGLAIRRALRRDCFDVVDAHNPQSQFWAAAAAIGLGTRRIATVHSVYREEVSSPRRGRAYESLLRATRGKRGRVIAVSPSVVDHLRGPLGISSEQVVLIGNAVCVDADPPGTATEPLLEFGWGDDEVVIAVGRLETVKGHHHLLAAIARLRTSRPRLRCLVVGEGPQRDFLGSVIADLDIGDIARLVGFRDDVPRLLRAASVLVQPSSTEAMPYTVLEAMAAGLPVVASRVGGLAALRDGSQAILVQPGDVTELVTAVDSVLSSGSLREKLASGGRAYVDECHDLGRMLHSTASEYSNPE